MKFPLNPWCKAIGIAACIVFIVILCIILWYVGNFKLTYIDETTTSGEGHGFIIGETKEQVFHKAAKIYQNDKILFPYPVDEQGYGLNKEITFTLDEYPLISDRNEWEFTFATDNFSDVIVLTFEKNRVIRIYRHRQKYELP